MTYNPTYAIPANILQNEALDIYSLVVSGSQYLKVFAAPNQWGNTLLSGVYVAVPNGGAPLLTQLNDDQTRQLAMALGHHVATGFVNSTINGISVVTSGNGVNVTVNSISYVTLLTNDQAQTLANALTHYEVTLPGFGPSWPY